MENWELFKSGQEVVVEKCRIGIALFAEEEYVTFSTSKGDGQMTG